MHVFVIVEYSTPLGIKMRCIMSKRMLTFIIAALTLVAGIFFWLMFDPSSGESVPANMPELCRIVGLNPETESACHGIGSLPILETAFPPKVATIEQVHAKLGSYLVDSRTISHWTHESYAILPGLLGPVRANFSFDSTGILMTTSIED